MGMQAMTQSVAETFRQMSIRPTPMTTTSTPVLQTALPETIPEDDPRTHETPQTVPNQRPTSGTDDHPRERLRVHETPQTAPNYVPQATHTLVSTNIAEPCSVSNLGDLRRECQSEETENRESRRKPGSKIPKHSQTYDGTGDWFTFLTLFELEAETSEWSDREASLALLKSLTGRQRNHDD